jgi:hypothetical protein
MIPEVLALSENKGKKVFVDTNICIDSLKEISDKDHVIVMLADPEISVKRFFDRPDPEKQFIYRLMTEEPDPAAAFANYREILKRINSKENYDYYLNCGFNVLLRDDGRTEEETVRLAEKMFKIGG